MRVRLSLTLTLAAAFVVVPALAGTCDAPRFEAELEIGPV
jgi:hypothetical protein